MASRIYKRFPCETPLPKEVSIYGIYDDWEGFRILLKTPDLTHGKGMIRVSFGTGAFAYRVIDEGDYLVTLSSTLSWLSIVENSEYLDWFHQESCGVRLDQGLVHYAIYTFGDCVDVIDSEPPVLEWL